MYIIIYTSKWCFLFLFFIDMIVCIYILFQNVYYSGFSPHKNSIAYSHGLWGFFRTWCAAVCTTTTLLFGQKAIFHSTAHDSDRYTVILLSNILRRPRRFVAGKGVKWGTAAAAACKRKWPMPRKNRHRHRTKGQFVSRFIIYYYTTYTHIHMTERMYI
jgi:hypothetical protein